MKNIVFIIVSMLIFVACKKDTVTEPTPPVNNTPAATGGTLKISFANMVDSLPLVYGTFYKNANGDTFNVNKFMYYVSNITLTKTDESVYKVPNSYHLINRGNDLANHIVNLSGIPEGTYKKITYLIGVDSARNVSGVQDGDLAPEKNMFWDWNTGYIMLKLEGYSPVSGTVDKSIQFHTGGFKGANNVLRWVSINFPTNLTISATKNPELKLSTNVNELFKNPNVYDFTQDYFIMSEGLRANTFANNYQDMTSFKEIVQ